MVIPIPARRMSQGPPTTTRNDLHRWCFTVESLLGRGADLHIHDAAARRSYLRRIKRKENKTEEFFLQHLRTSTAGSNSLFLDCPALEPLWRAIFDLWFIPTLGRGSRGIFLRPIPQMGRSGSITTNMLMGYAIPWKMLLHARRMWSYLRWRNFIFFVIEIPEKAKKLPSNFNNQSSTTTLSSIVSITFFLECKQQLPGCSFIC